MDIGIQCEEAVQQFTKQRDITFSGKAVTVQRHLNIHATQQKASFKTLYQAVLNVDNRLQTTAVHLAFGPVVQRQRAAQNFGVIHHR